MKFDPNEMSPFNNRGVPFLADENESIWTESGELLGYICSRGSQYGWGALHIEQPAPFTLPDDATLTPFSIGGGSWKGHDDDTFDPAMDSILAAHETRKLAECAHQGDTFTSDEGERCAYCNGLVETFPALRRLLESCQKLGNDPEVQRELTEVLTIIDERDCARSH